MPFDDLSYILKNHIAARTLRQAMTDFLADDFELIRIQSRYFRIRNSDDFDRYALVVEEQSGFIIIVAWAFRFDFTLMRRDFVFLVPGSVTSPRRWLTVRGWCRIQESNP